MLGFLKRGLYRRMKQYCATIQVATAIKLASDLIPTHGRNSGIRLSAAITNRLFAQSPSPEHASLDQSLITTLAEQFVSEQNGSDLLRGIVLSLRTMMAVETDNANADATERIARTIYWIKSLASLPPDTPDPKIMLALATTLQQRYTNSITLPST